jgi:hypothetical protein
MQSLYVVANNGGNFCYKKAKEKNMPSPNIYCSRNHHLPPKRTKQTNEWRGKGRGNKERKIETEGERKGRNKEREKRKTKDGRKTTQRNEKQNK